MKKRLVLFLIICFAAFLAVGVCSAEPKAEELPGLRKLSWEGNELTVTVGTNKSAGCEWKASFEDDSIIGYSINRKFHPILSKDGLGIGYSKIGFEGKRAGTAAIMLTTPNDWEGTGPGYTYVVTVTVGEDGTILSAEGEDRSAAALHAAEYSCIGLYYDKHFLSDPDFDSWTTTLDADGGGYIYWGEDNQGPISDWSVADRSLTIHAGVSTLEGMIANGLMILDLGDGIRFAWAAPEVDLEKLNIIPLAEYEAAAGN